MALVSEYLPESKFASGISIYAVAYFSLRYALISSTPL